MSTHPNWQLLEQGLASWKDVCETNVNEKNLRSPVHLLVLAAALTGLLASVSSAQARV